MLLFAPELVLPPFAPDFPASAAWLGQAIGAAWLAVAALNWLSSGMVLGGVYGRPVVAANTALYFITATVVIRQALDQGDGGALWLVAIPPSLLAIVYGWLLLRGPFERDLQR